MALHPKQIESVMALSGPERYKHFIKQIVDREEVWGLYKNGWAIASTNDGTHVFPVWPANEYAAKCAKDEWLDYEPSSMSLDDFMEELLPVLEKDGILLGIFYTPANKGVTLGVSQVLHDLQDELEKYS